MGKGATSSKTGTTDPLVMCFNQSWSAQILCWSANSSPGPSLCASRQARMSVPKVISGLLDDFSQRGWVLVERGTVEIMDIDSLNSLAVK